ncbi:matrixin family metalloprotease [Chryseobacterium sp.]|uniref:matrixin family metalloprotease n=1 Tax=Chryseobacterium sp. TaxID=1871047 RepID=UPI00289F9F94|nr:matrixin family metalloprotease [Chryseobacterium sp.]
MLFLFSCTKSNQENISKETSITILVQPFDDIPSDYINDIVDEIKKVYPKVKILQSINLPENSYYKPRNRYRADSLIQFLSERTEKNFVTIGITSKDISSTKGKIKDFGVMGLGFTPGKACVASTFRLNKTKVGEQLFKVAIHELGHTLGLSHCPEKTCFMRDAEGKNHTDEEKDFCKKCKTFLIEKNWRFK